MSNRKTWHTAGYLILTALLTVNQPFAQDELPVPEVAAQEEAPTESSSGQCPALTIPPDSRQQSRIRELFRIQDVCVNERVEVHGIVEQYSEERTETTMFYYMSDLHGVWIKVRSTDTENPPPPNTPIKIEGVFGYNRVRVDRLPDEWRTAFPEKARDNVIEERGGIYVSEPFLSEHTREVVCPPGQRQSAEGGCEPIVCGIDEVLSGATCECREGYQRNDAGVCEKDGLGWLWPAVGLAALVLIGLGIALVRTLGSKPATSTGTTTRVPGATPPRTPTGSTMPTDSGATAPTPRVVEGKTIKMHLPPDDKTVKVLPGRLKVKGGLDDITEVRFFMPQGRSTTEITFGRVEGRPYEHIQLKPRTVSSRQAKLVFDGGKYTLYNHASTESNPTTHNGRALGEGESVLLTDRDRITMGEVEFEFASS